MNMNSILNPGQAVGPNPTNSNPFSSPASLTTFSSEAPDLSSPSYRARTHPLSLNHTDFRAVTHYNSTLHTNSANHHAQAPLGAYNFTPPALLQGQVPLTFPDDAMGKENVPLPAPTYAHPNPPVVPSSVQSGGSILITQIAHARRLTTTSTKELHSFDKAMQAKGVEMALILVYSKLLELGQSSQSTHEVLTKQGELVQGIHDVQIKEWKPSEDLQETLAQYARTKLMDTTFREYQNLGGVVYAYALAQASNWGIDVNNGSMTKKLTQAANTKSNTAKDNLRKDIQTSLGNNLTLEGLAMAMIKTSKTPLDTGSALPRNLLRYAAHLRAVYQVIMDKAAKTKAGSKRKSEEANLNAVAVVGTKGKGANNKGDRLDPFWNSYEIAVNALHDQFAGNAESIGRYLDDLVSKDVIAHGGSRYSALNGGSSAGSSGTGADVVSLDNPPFETSPVLGTEESWIATLMQE